MGNKRAKAVTDAAGAAPAGPDASRVRSSQRRPSKEKPSAIVGIGASAGGLEAFTRLLTALPAKTGLAFVLIQHLDPKRESVLAQILSQKTSMPVGEASDGAALERDRVYIMPPNKDMTVSKGVLGLRPRTETRGIHMPVDRFFRSLAEDQKNLAIGVVLSGTASDGALGLKAIKAEGGISFAQDEKSAKFGGMPHSAMASGAADFVLPPEGIASELVRISGRSLPKGKDFMPAAPPGEEGPLPANEDSLGKIFALLQARSGVDFAQYKRATPSRRVLRRMTLRRIADIEGYVQYLENNPKEIEALYQDLLIHVTSFFRDPDAFAALASSVFPEILKGHRGEGPVRFWVPGCSSGEEAYSLAIAFVEFLGSRPAALPIQIFATDILETSIDSARSGKYPENAVSELSQERLERFVKLNGHYQVNKNIRELCVFAKHDLTKDPPFSNLDLISCRNVLIYLGTDAQARAMGNFHYALRPGGFLLLGTSEAIGRFPDLFDAVDRKHKIFSRRPGLARALIAPRPAGYPLGRAKIARGESEAVFDPREEADRTLLSRLAPAGVVVDHQFEVLDFRGNTSPFLEHRPGDASLNLFELARKGLQAALRSAIQKAKTRSAPVRMEGLRVELDGGKEVNLDVIPLVAPPHGDGHFLILFEAVHGGRPRRGEAQDHPPIQGRAKFLPKRKARAGAGEEQLEQELKAAQEKLAAVIEERESADEELRAANEEALSANEELQSINEELETAKEELQSTNEELTTLNDELQNRNAALDELNNDLSNLFTSANLPVILLGRDLHLRRFTALAEKRLGVQATDVGRFILNVRLNTDIPELETLIKETLDTGGTKEIEVKDREGTWYSLQIRPYRSAENSVSGAVLTWIDISSLKRSLEEVRESRDYAEAIVETIREPLIVLDKDLKVKTANGAFYQTFRTSPAETENRFIYDLGDGQWNIPELKRLLEDILPNNTPFQALEIEHDFPVVGYRAVRLNGRRILQGRAAAPLILLAMEDVTGQQLREVHKLAAIGTLTGGIAHDLNNVLAPIITGAELTLLDLPGESSLREPLRRILKSGLRGKDLVRQLLLFSRKSAPKKRVFSLSPLISESLAMLRSSIPKTIDMSFHLKTEPDLVMGDSSQIQQVILNLCANAAYAMKDKTGSIDVSIGAVTLGLHDLPEKDMTTGEYLVLSVADTGSGMDEEVMRRAFEPFFTTKPLGEGTGLGLSVAHGIVKSHKGGMSVSSEPGKGSVFRVYLPKAKPGAALETETEERYPGGSERILFVDDEELIVGASRKMLERLGYQVTAHTDGREALKLFTQDPYQFDLVITDRFMPAMAGEDLAQAMMLIRPDIPIIMSTGYSDLDSIEKARTLGFRGFIAKPYTMREAARIVRSVLDRRGSPEA